MKPISKLQYITTSAELAEDACSGGIDWIQLRLKNVGYDEYYAVGREVQKVCKKHKATLIINDNPRLALDLGADGVHIGKEDPLPQEDIDELLKRCCIIGCTANTIEDFLHLAGKPVSYVGLGPFRYTTTKQNLSPVLGQDGYSHLFTEIKLRGLIVPPIIGIGGIEAGDVHDLLKTGLHGIAVSGAISNAPDKVKAAKKFKQEVYGSFLSHLVPDLDILTDIIGAIDF